MNIEMHDAKELSMTRAHARPIIGLFLLIAAAVFASAIIFSCNDPEGLYYSLRMEDPVNEGATAALDKTTPAAMVRLGDKYFLAAGQLFSRAASLGRVTNSWTQAVQPPDTAFCTSIAASSSRLYASFTDSNALSLGVYYSDGTGTALAWTELAPEIFHQPAATGMRVIALMEANGIVFISYEVPSSDVRRFRLQAVDESGAAPVTLDSGVDISFDSSDPWDYKPIVSMAYDGTDYWFISGASLYRGTPGAFALVSGEAGMPSKTSLKSIRWSSDLGRILVTTGSGMFRASDTVSLAGSTPGLLYSRTPGGTWEASAPISLIDSATGGYANFTDSAVVPGTGSGLLLLLGSEASVKYGDGDLRTNKAVSAKGYGTFRPASDGSIALIASGDLTTLPLASPTNLSTTLVTDAVTGFYQDASYPDGARILFALTLEDGLFSNRYDGSSWEGWYRE
jgi:hypothetical protein